mgnify:CR=1 FL=1
MENIYKFMLMNKSYWSKVLVIGFFVFMQMTGAAELKAQTSKNSLYKQTSEMADMMIQYDASQQGVMTPHDEHHSS